MIRFKKIKNNLFIGVFFFLSYDALGSTEDHQIPVDDFFISRTEFQHRLSPNGKYLGYIKDYPTYYALQITDLDKKEIIYDTPISRQYPHNLNWVSNRRLLFNGDGKIYAINIDGTDLRILIDNVYDWDSVKGYRTLKKNFKSWWVENNLNDNEEEILVKSMDANDYQSVHRINIYTGDKKDLYDGKKHKINNWIVDGDGNVKLGVRRDKDASVFFEVGLAEEDLKLTKFSDEYDLDFDGKSYLEKRAFIVGPSYEDGKVYIAENRETGRFRIVQFDYKKKEKLTILEDPVYDVGETFSKANLLYDPDKKTLVGVRYQAGRQKTVWFDEKLKKIQETLDEKYSENINQIVDWTPDYSKTLVFSRSERSLGRILVFLPKENKIVVQADFSANVDAESFRKTKLVNYPTKDGYQVEAYITMPKGENAKNLPVVIYPHGGPFARTYFGYDSYVQYLASRGYVVIEPNFRGSVGYGRKHLLSAKAAIHSLMVDDIVDSAHWAIKTGLADKEKVYIMGFSYGGYAGLMASIKYPELFSAVVSYGAPVDIKSQMKAYKKNNNDFAYEFWDEMVIGEDKSRNHIKELSPIERIADIKVPVIVMHGEDDAVVSVEQAEEFKKKAENKNKLIDVAILKDEGHGVRLKSNKIYFISKVERFFGNH